MRFILIILLLFGSQGTAQVPRQSDTATSNPATFVEELPKFPGGENALIKYISDSLKYPPQAREHGIEGTMVLQFVVQKDGSIADIVVKRDIGGGTAEEAIRMVRTMPRWTPAKTKGEPVSCYFLLPVTFQDKSSKPGRKPKRHK